MNATPGSPPTWRLTGHSVVGASHVRTGKVNQDALCIQPAPDPGAPVALAVSDGHGSAKHFRSQEGSWLAVEEAVRTLADWGNATPSSSTSALSEIKRVSDEKLTQEICRKWTAAVQEDVNRLPFTEDELSALSDRDRAVVIAKPVLAYGATLLATLITPRYVLHLQLGDGDIVEVYADGRAGHAVEPDARLIADETTSLSADDAWRDFRTTFRVATGELPVLVMLATDGYSKSFETDAEFLQAGPDILAAIRQYGLDDVESQLPEWLRETSDAGSGDDITVTLAYRQEPPDCTGPIVTDGPVAVMETVTAGAATQGTGVT